MVKAYRSIVWSILFGLLWTLALLASTGGSAHSSGGSIAGRITDETGNPLDRIWVLLHHRLSAPDEPPLWDSAGFLTGPDGRFYFGGLADGVYRLSAEHSNFPNPPDYEGEFYEDKSDLTSADDILLSDGGAVEDLLVRLKARASISGLIVSDEGVPLSAIRAVAIQVDPQDGFWGEAPGIFRSDATGVYTISGLMEGTYRVRFEDNLSRVYWTEYFDNAPDLESALDISVTVGARITGVNASLSPSGGISGVVTNDEGAPLAEVNVGVYRLVSAESHQPYWELAAATGSRVDGSYTTYGLATGLYRVSFHTGLYVPQYYASSLTVEDATDVSVTNGLVTPDINVQMQRLGSLGGEVFGFDGLPLAGIQIQALRGERQNDGAIQWHSVERTTTDADGVYHLPNLQPGDYLLYAEKPENPLVYLDIFYPDVRRIENATPIPLAADQHLTGLNFQMLAAQRITGTVTGPEGQPLLHICVRVWRAEPGTDVWQEIAQAETNLQGHYRLGELADGLYRLKFTDCFANGLYAAEFYDNIDEFADAIILELPPKGHIRGVNAQLGLRSHITGRVTDSLGQPIPEVVVTAYRLITEGPSAGEWISAGTTNTDLTDLDGVYSIDRQEAGRYRLHFFDSRTPSPFLSEYYDDAYRLEDATDIVVGRSMTVSDVNVILTSGGSITGVVTNPAGRPVGEIIVTAWRQKRDGPGAPAWENVSWAKTGGDGRYTIRRLEPVIYRVLFDDFEMGRYSSQYYKSAALIELANDVLVERDSVTSGIDAQLSHAASIAGQLKDPDGQPAVGVAVAAYQWVADGEGRWVPVRDIESDAQGHYQIGGLLAGSYRVGFAVTDLQLNSAFVAQYYSDAAEIEHAVDLVLVSGQQRTGINASLARRPQIQGRVSDEADAPLLNISVTLFGLNTLNGQENWILRSFANTGEDGRYSFAHLLPGIYRIGFGDSTNPPGYRSEYYDDVRRFSQALSITATANAVVIGIDARLSSFFNNSPPIAYNDHFTATQGRTTVVPSVLLNDEDADGDPLSLIFEQQPAHGSISFVGEQEMSYTHDGSNSLADSFTYRATDGVSQSNVATVTISIKPVVYNNFVYLPLILHSSAFPTGALAGGKME
jgi:5-hydroxyisourate hydrolase-like protein (transthyretin family)